MLYDTILLIEYYYFLSKPLTFKKLFTIINITILEDLYKPYKMYYHNVTRSFISFANITFFIAFLIFFALSVNFREEVFNKYKSNPPL